MLKESLDRTRRAVPARLLAALLLVPPVFALSGVVAPTRAHALSGDPFGVLEGVTAGAGTVTAFGWAMDPDTTDPVFIHVYVDNQLETVVSANRSRPDVDAVYHRGSLYGYEATVAVRAGSHTVCTYAINRLQGDTNTQLGCKTVTVPMNSAGTFVSLPPVRILDTRAGNGAPRAPIPAEGVLSLQVTGRGGVPATGVAAVAMNVTVTNPAAGGFVTAFPSGTTLPTASNLNFVAGETIPNMVVVAVGGDGRVKFKNGSRGSIDLLADLAGYFLAGTPTTPGAFVSLQPTRLLDTRVGLGAVRAPVAPGADVAVAVKTPSGVTPDTVFANVTVTNPRGAGYLTAYPSGSALPEASNINFVAGQTIPNLVAVKVGVDGRVLLRNGSGGSFDVIVDIAGYTLPGVVLEKGAFSSQDPTRRVDTRTGYGAQRAQLPAGGSITVNMAADAAVGKAMNITVTNTSADGYLSAYPAGGSTPLVSNVNFRAGQTIANFAIVRTSAGDGDVTFTNGSAGPLDLVVDVAGFFMP